MKKTIKPLLVKVGKNYIDPSDVSRITQVKDRLYVVEFKSNPNPEYKCWVNKGDVEVLLNQFNIQVSD